MWCHNHGQVSKIPTDPRTNKLRPIMPRPFPNTFPTTPCCYPNNNHHLKIPAWNHLLSGYGGKRETMMSTVPFVSSRWNPTREQLQALEEMYRNGIRTPSAQQIQQITAKLRRFGKIEGKNVFYWFQNHKARERQKKRRQMEESNTRDVIADERPEKRRSDHGVRRTYLETKHPRKQPTPSSCSTSSEYSASMQGSVVQECKQEKWDCKDLQEHNLTAKRIETWWPLDLSFCMPLNSNNNNNNNNNQENEKPFVANKLSPPTNKTLQLFPVGSNDSSFVKFSYTEEEEEKDNNVSTVGPESGSPNKFFEFLPIKY